MTHKTEAEYRIILTRLNKALSDSTKAATKDRVNLRDAVCAYISAEQARGTPLGSITQAVKEILKKTEEVATRATGRIGQRDDDLAQQLVDWCGEFHRTRAERA